MLWKPIQEYNSSAPFHLTGIHIFICSFIRCLFLDLSFYPDDGVTLACRFADAAILLYSCSPYAWVWCSSRDVVMAEGNTLSDNHSHPYPLSFVGVGSGFACTTQITLGEFPFDNFVHWDWKLGRIGRQLHRHRHRHHRQPKIKTMTTHYGHNASNFWQPHKLSHIHAHIYISQCRQQTRSWMGWKVWVMN